MFFLCLFGLICIYPIIYILAVSFSGSLPVMEGRVWLYPVEFHLKAYEIVFSNDNILRSYLNTILYTLIGTLFNLIAITCAAYPLSKKRLHGRSAFSLYFVFTILFSGGMIPNFLLIQNLGFYDTMWAVTVPGAVSVFYMIILRTNFEQIPDALEEAAIIEVLHTLMQNVCRRTERIDLSPDQTFFLFSLATFSEKEQADFSKNLHLFLQDVLRLFSHDAENIRVHFVVSNLIPSARDLASAYSELNLFSQRIIGADDESAVIDIPPILPPSPPEIPQEQAEKLRNLLLMGDLDGLERLFPELFEKNICTLEQADQHYHWLFSHIEALFQERCRQICHRLWFLVESQLAAQRLQEE